MLSQILILVKNGELRLPHDGDAAGGGRDILHWALIETQNNNYWRYFEIYETSGLKEALEDLSR